MKTFKCVFTAAILAILLGACDNFFHDLIPPDGDRILSFEVPDQIGTAVISDDTVSFAVKQDADVNSMIPVIKVSPKASVLPITPEYLQLAFPSADIAREAIVMAMTSDLPGYIWNLIENSPDFTVPDLTLPVDFSRPVNFIVISAKGTLRHYSAGIGNASQLGEPGILSLSFSKYDNPELVTGAECQINERSRSISVLFKYPMEIPGLSFALIPSFEIWADKFEVDGREIVSGKDAIQFNPSFGSQIKILSVTLGDKTSDYTLSAVFAEDPDSIRSITDFRFYKADNSGIASDAVAGIVNSGASGTITVQILYSGAKPSYLVPCFISPGTVSINGTEQFSGSANIDFSSPQEYTVISKNLQYTRVYTVKVEFINLTTDAPKILSFTFPRSLNAGLVQDSEGEINDEEGQIRSVIRYGGSFATDTLIPEFTAQGLVTVSGSVQISGASERDFSRQVKYTVTNPLNPMLKRDYMVDCQFVRDVSSDATITEFGFYPEDNIGLAESLPARVDHDAGKITLIAPIGSGVTSRVMNPRFSSAGQVTVEETVQYSGFSGHIFSEPLVYVVVSANGLNRKEYTVDVRELGTTIYVNPDATGQNNGLSWNDAFRSLQAACEAATMFMPEIPKEIWIAKGTYKPGDTTDDFFQIAPNTSYIGGFAGNESSKSQRNVSANRVIISGNITKGRTNHIQAAFFSRTMLMNSEDAYFEDLEFEQFTLNQKNSPSFIYNPISIRWSSRAAGNINVINCNFTDVNGPCIEAYNGSAVLRNINAKNTAAVYHNNKTANETNVMTTDIIENVKVDTQIPYGGASDFDPLFVIYSGEFANSSVTIDDVEINDCSLGMQIHGGASVVSVNKIKVNNVTTIDRPLGEKGSVLEIYGSTRLSVSNVEASNIINGKSFMGTVFINEPRGIVLLDTVTIKNVTVTDGDQYGGAGGIAVNWAFGGPIYRGNRVEMKNVRLEGIDWIFLPALGVYKPETDVYFDNVTVSCNSKWVYTDDLLYYLGDDEDLWYLIYLIERGRIGGCINIDSFNSFNANKMHAETLTGENIFFTANSPNARIDISDFTARKARFTVNGADNSITIKDYKGATGGEINITSARAGITAERIDAASLTVSNYNKLSLNTAKIDGYLSLSDYYQTAESTDLRNVETRDVDTSKDLRLSINCNGNLTITDSTLRTRARTRTTYTDSQTGSQYTYATNKASISVSPNSSNPGRRPQGVFNNVTFDFYTAPGTNYATYRFYIYGNELYGAIQPGVDLRFTNCRFNFVNGSDPFVGAICMNNNNNYYDWGTSNFDLNGVQFTYTANNNFRLFEVNRPNTYRISYTSSLNGTTLGEGLGQLVAPLLLQNLSIRVQGNETIVPY